MSLELRPLQAIALDNAEPRVDDGGLIDGSSLYNGLRATAVCQVRRRPRFITQVHELLDIICAHLPHIYQLI